MKKLRLWQRYFADIALAIILAVIAIGTYDIATTYLTTRLAAMAQLQSFEVGISQRIQQYFENVVAQANEVARLPLAATDTQTVQVELGRLLRVMPEIERVEIRSAIPGLSLALSQLEPNGPYSTFSVDIQQLGLPVNVGDKEVRFGRTLYAGDYHPTVIMAFPFSGDEAVLCVQIGLSEVAKTFTGLVPSNTVVAYLADQDDRIVAHTQNEKSLRRDISRVLQRFPSAEFSRSVVQGAGVRGEPVFAVTRFVAGPGWRLVVEQERNAVFQPVWSAVWRSVFILLVGLGAAVIGSGLLARRLAKPIVVFASAAKNISDGNYQARVENYKTQEFDVLSSEFNKMASQLQSYTTDLEKKVSEKTAQLEQANRHKSEFLANMSHELRTPLNAVIGFSDVLKEQYFGELNPKQQQYVKDINESGQHLLSLINDILDLSKIEAGKMDLELSRFHLPTSIDNALVLVRERAMRRQLQLKATIAEGIGDIVADERKVKQILINLLTNAVKFSHPNGWVEVIVARGTKETMLTVKDMGPGIAREDQQAIFEEFHQLKAEGSAKQEGTGLGLSLARRFTQLHGGRIWVDSEVGAGAAFTFTLPDRPVPVAETAAGQQGAVTN